ncbi:MAG: ribbon-helix-helix protein, CopG family [Candidatus Helarchaeota archaeon]
MNKTSRITFSLNEDILEIINELKDDLKLSKSRLINTALTFYYNYRKYFEKIENYKILTYLDMLSTSEHIIIDIDHFILFLKLIEDNEEFWKAHREIAKAHADQFAQKDQPIDSFFKRLEACNLFIMQMGSINCYTLLLGSEVHKKFIRIFLDEFFKKLKINVDIVESLSKIRIKIKNSNKKEDL